MTALGLPWLNDRLRGPTATNPGLVPRPAFALRATFPISAFAHVDSSECAVIRPQLAAGLQIENK